jgi:translation initiation factor IF-3
MISPEAEPPVVRIMNYSKYKYELQKKKREAQKKAAANRQELKELKMRYNIDTHDYDVRLRAAQRFLKDGYKDSNALTFHSHHLGANLQSEPYNNQVA